MQFRQFLIYLFISTFEFSYLTFSKKEFYKIRSTFIQGIAEQQRNKPHKVGVKKFSVRHFCLALLTAASSGGVTARKSSMEITCQVISDEVCGETVLCSWAGQSQLCRARCSRSRQPAPSIAAPAPAPERSLPWQGQQSQPGPLLPHLP